MKKKKILFLPAGGGLAHVGRCAELAKELKKRGFGVFFGIGEWAKVVLEKEGLSFEVISEITREIFEKKIRRFNLSVFTVKMIEDFVKAELSLYKKQKPSLIVADTRPTAFISTKVAGIPLITIAATEATPFYDFKKTKIRLPSYWSSFLPKRIIKILEKERGEEFLKKVAPPLIRLMMADQLFRVNLVLLKHKLKPLVDPFEGFLGDLTFLLDPPFFKPVKPLPENVKIVGPIFWEGVKALPSWAKKVERGKRGKRGKRVTIYLTAGGTGDKRIFEKCLKFLSETPYQIIATIGNTAPLSEIKVPKREGIFLTDFVPGGWAMEKANLVIFPGGNSTCYQALFAGCPQIGIPTNIDQEDNLNQLEKLGTAILIDPFRELNRETLLSGIEKILACKKYRQKTKRLQRKLLRYNGKEKAADLIEEFLKRS